MRVIVVGDVMSLADAYVRARIDMDTKARAADTREAMGLSISGAIRLLMGTSKNHIPSFRRRPESSACNGLDTGFRRCDEFLASAGVTNF